MKAIKFNTGRQYTAEGQVIVAYQVGEPEQDEDFPDTKWYTVRFLDLSRMVSGEMTTMGLRQSEVMGLYDLGHYRGVFISDQEKAEALAAVA